MSNTSLALVPPTPDVAAFGYGALSDYDAGKLREVANAIRERGRKVGQHIIAIGDLLLTVKRVLGHGHFGAWIAAEFGWSERTAQNYMRAAEVFGSKSEIVADLPPTTIYRLSSPSTPLPVRASVMQRLEAGERVRPDAIRDMLTEAREAAKETRRLAKMTARQRARHRRTQEEAERDRAKFEREQINRDAAIRNAVEMILSRFTDGDLDAFLGSLRRAQMYALHLSDIEAARERAQKRGNRTEITADAISVCDDASEGFEPPAFLVRRHEGRAP